MGFSIINHPFWGVFLLFLETPFVNWFKTKISWVFFFLRWNRRVFVLFSGLFFWSWGCWGRGKCLRPCGGWDVYRKRHFSETGMLQIPEKILKSAQMWLFLCVKWLRWWKWKWTKEWSDQVLRLDTAAFDDPSSVLYLNMTWRWFSFILMAEVLYQLGCVKTLWTGAGFQASKMNMAIHKPPKGHPLFFRGGGGETFIIGFLRGGVSKGRG